MQQYIKYHKMYHQEQKKTKLLSKIVTYFKHIAYTGCLKNNMDLFENAVTPSFMEETFNNFHGCSKLIPVCTNVVLLSDVAAYRK